VIGRAGQFRRVLGLWQLTCIGLGGLIGVGIFVLTGVVVAIQAGPAAYTYAYAVLLGETRCMGNLLGSSARVCAGRRVVSIGWSGYFQALLSQLGLTLPTWAMGASGTGRGHVLDLPAMLGSLAVAGLLKLRIT
jgi:APA family basic amino acid/polyamine antiporter